MRPCRKRGALQLTSNTFTVNCLYIIFIRVLCNLCFELFVVLIIFVIMFFLLVSVDIHWYIILCFSRNPRFFLNLLLSFWPPVFGEVVVNICLVPSILMLLFLRYWLCPSNPCRGWLYFICQQTFFLRQPLNLLHH